MDVDALSAHRIVSLQTVQAEVRFPDTIGKNAAHHGIGASLQTQIRVLVTDGGVVGWGHSLSKSIVPDLVVGHRVSDLFDPASGTKNSDVLALDFALQDLAGKILNVPVYKMIDQLARPEVQLYYGSVDMLDLGQSVQAGTRTLIRRCDKIYEQGYRSFKLKIGRGFRWMTREDGLKRDIEITRMLSRRFQDCRMLVDANDGFSYEDCVSYLKAVADCSIFWMEEPFPENEKDLESLRTFLYRDGLDTLIADGETAYNVDSVMRLSKLGLIDVALMDIGKLGLTEWRSLAQNLLRNGTALAPHTCCNPLKIIYASHLAAGFASEIPIESFSATCNVIDKQFENPTGELFRLSDLPGFGIQSRNQN